MIETINRNEMAQTQIVGDQNYVVNTHYIKLKMGIDKYIT